MSRARRLAEIAKANEPAFSGTQWWLADPTAKPDPAPPNEPAVPPPAPEPVPAAVTVPAAPKQLTIVEAPVFHANGPLPVAANEPSSVPFMATSPLNLSGQVAAPQAEQNSSELVTRLTGLKEKFLGLGRKSRAANPD